VPELFAAVSSDHILAIGSIGDRLLILLDIERRISEPVVIDVKFIQAVPILDK
jgi:hypothetical protein